MKRVRLVVAYDGTHYHGWQIQPGRVTIESELNEKLTMLLGEPIQVIGASRTDSGVHARGNVAVFDTEHRMPADKICLALNGRADQKGRNTAYSRGYKAKVIGGGSGGLASQETQMH